MPLAKRFFSAAEQQMLEEAIKVAELKTSAEIVIHLDNFCWGKPLIAAKRRFAGLGMYKTAERNGVLIYIATINRKIAVLGDEGIHQKLGTAYWEEKVQNLIMEFKANHKAEALSALVLDLGSHLGRYFPRSADEQNELGNRISFK